jgi:hypothetical protein
MPEFTAWACDSLLLGPEHKMSLCCISTRLCCTSALVAAITGSATADVTFGVSPDGGVYSLDLSTAEASLVFSGPFEWLGAANSGRDGIIYGAVGFDNGFDSLHEIDVINLTVTPIGDWGGIEIRELAYDTTRNILYGSEQDELYEINQANGRASLIGRYFGPSSMYAMTHIPSLDLLVGIDFATNLMYHISPDTGRATLVGDAGVNRIADLWFDRATDRLYGVTNFEGSVYEINPHTGAMSFVGTSNTHLTGLGQGIPSPTAWLPIAGAVALHSIRRTRTDIGA